MKSLAVLFVALLVIASNSPVQADHDNGPSAPTHFVGVSLGGVPGDDGSLPVALCWTAPCHWGRGTHDGFIITYAPYHSHNFNEYTTVDASTHNLTIYLVPGKWVIRVAAITSGRVGDYNQIVVRVP